MKQKLYFAFQTKMREIRENTGQDPECVSNYDAFFPDEYHDAETRQYAVKTAKDICNRCPLLLDCAEYAIDANEQHGIWGSTTPAERAAIQENLKRFRRRNKS
jgi:hypothetical protein